MNPSKLMSTADDLVHDFRMLAGSDDLDQAVIILKDMTQLVNDATGLDRQCETDDTTMALGYILNAQEIMIGNLPAIPAGNKSRTATIAAEHRANAA